MVESARNEDWINELIRFVSDCPEEVPNLDDRLAGLASNPDWAGADGAFEFWAGRQSGLPPKAWRTLTDAKSVWLRAMTYATFSTRCEPAWKDTLLSDLRAASAPLPAAEFGRLLAGLDDDDFDVRERASAALRRLGERAEVPLREAAKGPLSPEAARRVAEVLAALEKAKQSPDCVRALDYLAAHDAPECGELLQVLADGEPGAWLTRQAKDKLAGWRKRRGLSDE